MAPPSIAQFSHLLSKDFKPEDDSWSFKVDNLPRDEVANASRWIKCITLESTACIQQMKLCFANAEPNRAVDGNQLHRYIQLSFEKFQLQDPSIPASSLWTALPPRQTADYKVRLLRRGITINSITYRFFGHSNSQLKTSTCYLFAGKEAEISTIIEGFGDFAGIKTVAKKAKRIGLLFSAAKVATTLAPDRCEDFSDVKAGDYIFTDGCGLLSKHFAQHLSQTANIRFRNKRFVPSVFQIRYRGYKGVLTLEPKLPPQCLAKFRSSMQKFKGSLDYSFAVVDYARPYAFGFLNDEVILLLDALRVDASTLLRKQAEHFEFLKRACIEPLDAFRLLSHLNEPLLAEKVLLNGLETVAGTVRRLVTGEISKLVNKRGQPRSRILIPKSRLLFGVCDPRNLLKEGQCAVRVTMADSGGVKTITGTEVLVTRNPCLHPGDLQKFRAVEFAELSHLVDCIVFPVKGKRPSADLMSGGDLDGDKFFVTWDADIIPPIVAEPARYTGPREPVSFRPITYDDRLVYFATYTNASLGRVKKLFLEWARSKGPMSAECQELNFLFSHCVDGNRIAIPTRLRAAPENQENTTPFILDVLHNAAKELAKDVLVRTGLQGSTLDVVEVLLCRENVAMSEFDLFQMALRWCRETGRDIWDLFNLFDFNQLSDDQRNWILGTLPPEKSVPELVLNALTGSQILTIEELRSFKLDGHQIKWKRLYTSTEDRMAQFTKSLSRAIDLFQRKFVVINVSNRFTLALYIPTRLESHKELLVDDSCRLFAFPHSQDNSNRHRRVVSTRAGYRLSYSDTGLQLYQTTKGDTFIFIRAPGQDDSTYRGVLDQGDRRRQRQVTVDSGENSDCIVSVALNKFSDALLRQLGRVNRDPIVAAEIYVIGNRDVRSMQILDQWLHFIDTQEILPLFEQSTIAYSIPSLSNWDWSKESDLLFQIARHENFQYFGQMSTLEAFKALNWLSERDTPLLRRVFRYLLPAAPGKFRPGGRVGLLRKMLAMLFQVPAMVTEFTQITPWDQFSDDIANIFREQIRTFLRAIVLCANDMGGLTIEPFCKIIKEARSMSLHLVAELSELIALTVESPETALDLFNGVIELESPRLFTARPSIVRYYIRACIGVAMEHIEEARESKAFRKDHIRLQCGSQIDQVTSQVRIDAHADVRLATLDHVRLQAVTMPSNSLLTPYKMHALIESSSPGCLRFTMLHPPPAYLENTTWKLKHCASFVTSRAMLEALERLVLDPEEWCLVQSILLCNQHLIEPPPTPEYHYVEKKGLNSSQNLAVKTLLNAPVTCIWGPPGTGKTHTLAIALEELLLVSGSDKILVSAPTHNAVDNLLRAFIANRKEQKRTLPNLVRVSTEVRKVAHDLREYTCDAMAGKDLNENPAARKKAQGLIDQARLVFTTCAGSSLGLIRNIKFPVVIVDEASQQTEPQSLIPLTKGCTRAVLVGDHVQLRATVRPHAQLQGYDVSLFERLFCCPEPDELPRSSLQKVMLNTQYRMHRSICAFSSKEFYNDDLSTAVPDDERQLPSTVKWPQSSEMLDNHLFYVESASPEDLGGRSKNNKGQVALARHFCDMLTSGAITSYTEKNVTITSNFTVAALTPYTACATELRQQLPDQILVSSIDGFQGREVDIVIFVTTRCNPSGEIGFLRDMRRLNVVVTRAKTALVIIGNKATLCRGLNSQLSSEDQDPELAQAKSTWSRLIGRCIPFDIEMHNGKAGEEA